MKQIGRSLILFFIVSALSHARTVDLAVSNVTETFFPDIINRIEMAYHNLDVEINRVRVPGEQAIALFKQGLLDADVMRLEGYRQIQPNALRVNVVIAQLPIMAMVRIDSPLTHPDQLTNKQMASVRGVRSLALIADRLQINTTIQETFEQSARMVVSGRADFLAVSPNIASSLLEQGLSLRMMETPLLTLPFYHWVTPENADLIPGLEAQLKRSEN